MCDKHLTKPIPEGDSSTALERLTLCQQNFQNDPCLLSVHKHCPTIYTHIYIHISRHLTRKYKRRQECLGLLSFCGSKSVGLY